MPTYKWKGLTLAGKNCRGSRASSSVLSLKHELRSEGIALLSSKEIKRVTPLKATSKAALFFDLSTLLESDIPLLLALQLTREQTSSRKISTILSSLEQEVAHGQTLAHAMSTKKELFSPLEQAVIACGENSGKLGYALGLLSSSLQQRLFLTKKMREAALVPVITLCSALLITMGIITYIVPQIEPHITSSQQLSSSTKLLFAASHFLQGEHNRILLLLGLFMLFVFFKGAKRINILALWGGKIALKLPLLGMMICYANTVHLTRALALLIRSGYTIKKGLALSKNVCTNKVLSQQVADVEKSIERGQSLHTAFAQLEPRYFPKKLVALIRIGEETGKLPEMLEKSHHIFQAHLLEKITLFSTLLQPLLLLLVGLFIALLLVALYLPLFSIFA